MEDRETMNQAENKKLLFPVRKIWIKDLGVGDKTDTYYKILSVDKKTKKDGNPYLSLMLMDKTGKIPAKIWNNAETHYKAIREGHIYRVNGSVNEFMNQKEIRVESLRAAADTDSDCNPEDFAEQAAFDTEKLFADLIGLMKSNLDSPHLLKLVDLFAEEYGEPFKAHYGAQKIHHAYLGGLLEHTLSMMKVAIYCAHHYHLDKELLIMGVLFHDLGKMYEFNISPTVETTMEGGLLGHLVIGIDKFQQLSAKVAGFPEEMSCKIQHLIVSHHGEKEFGSPEVPKIPEAFVLHVIDLLDSKMKIFEEAIRNSETKGIFSDYVKVLGRRLYVPPGEGNK
jgi:3'-5' exoribonuclease